MPAEVVSGCKWTSCCWLLLLAVLTSSCSSSASPLAAFHPRSTRSAGVVDTSDDVDDERQECSSDFAEKVVRILNGPASREAALAAVVNLLSDEDRDVLRAMAEISAPSRVSSPGFARKLSPSRRQGEFFPTFSLSDAKRLAPKFNPSGWRRKREVTSADPSVRRTLIGLLRQHKLGHRANFDRTQLASLLAEDDVSVGTVPEAPEWESVKRSSGVRDEQSLSRRMAELKRKPLEFNPTGW